MNIRFFEPTSPFAALEEEWELQGNNASDAYQMASALKKDGDFLRGVQYDGKKTLSLSFIGRKTTGDFSLSLSSAAALAAGVVATVEGLAYHIDNISIGYSQNSQPTLSISAHAHLDGRGHGPAASGGDGGCRIYLPSLTFPALDIGVPSSLEGAFTLSDECALSLRSLNYQLQVNHVDELDRIGRHLAGDNHDGTETLSAEFTGEFSTGDFTLGDEWYRDSTATPRNNTGVNTTTVQLTHHVMHETADAASTASVAADDGE